MITRILAATALWAATPLPAQAPAAPVIVLTRATLIDGSGGAPMREASVVVRNGRIERIAVGAVTVAGATVIDLQGDGCSPASWTRTCTFATCRRRARRSPPA